MKDEWIRCEDRMPPIGKVVDTKIDDAKGCRNERTLKCGRGQLWFRSDTGIYVYRKPTHWRETEAA